MFVLCWTILPTCKELSMQHIFFLHAKVSGINIWFILFTLTLDVTLNATESFYVHKKGKLKKRSRCCPFQVLFLQTVLTYASRAATKNILHPMQHTSGAFSISIFLAHSWLQMHILLWEAKRPGTFGRRGARGWKDKNETSKEAASHSAINWWRNISIVKPTRFCRNNGDKYFPPSRRFSAVTVKVSAEACRMATRARV